MLQIQRSQSIPDPSVSQKFMTGVLLNMYTHALTNFCKTQLSLLHKQILSMSQRGDLSGVQFVKLHKQEVVLQLQE